MLASLHLRHIITRPNAAGNLLHHVSHSKTSATNVKQFQCNFFRSFRTNITSKSPRPIRSIQVTPFEIERGPVPSKNVLKAFVFTGTFSFGCFVGATLMEYENTRTMLIKKARQARYVWHKKKQNMENLSLEEWKRNWDNFWQELTPGEKIFVPICALNLLVFGLWRVPSLRNTMLKYFCSNPASRAICWPMFLSTFSHYSFFHIFANMYVLHSFVNPAVLSMGKEQFLAFYMSAGVLASFTSILYKTISSQAGLSIGASGAIMAILGYVCTQYPDTQLSLLFLPMLTFSAGSAIKVLIGIDLVGCIMGWKFFDHAAHLGGALFGVFWTYFGREVWQQRIPILTMYHDWRKTK